MNVLLLTTYMALNQLALHTAMLRNKSRWSRMKNNTLPNNKYVFEQVWPFSRCSAKQLERERERDWERNMLWKCKNVFSPVWDSPDEFCLLLKTLFGPTKDTGLPVRQKDWIKTSTIKIVFIFVIKLEIDSWQWFDMLDQCFNMVLSHCKTKREFMWSTQNM